MKKNVLYILMCTVGYLIPSYLNAQSLTLIVKNPMPQQRQELVEVDYRHVNSTLRVGRNEALVVYNAHQQQVDYQITADSLLLIDCPIRGNGEAKFTITKGIPKQMKRWVEGRFFPNRMDDLTWENDRGIYRAYGPALQKSGERAYGFDVWTKNTPDLVVSNRYVRALDGTVRQQILKKKGRKEEAKEVWTNTTFHLDQGDGQDVYNVGPTLGCGTPSLMENGKIAFPWCFESYDILDNGPLRFTVVLNYPSRKVNGNENVVEHRLISLDKGSNFNKISVWYEGLDKPTDMVAGFVIHSADKKSVVLGKDFVQYADPTDSPANNNFQIYIATLFPQGAKTQTIWNEKEEGGVAGHAVGLVRNLYSNQPYTYYFGSAWSAYDVRTQDEWALRIAEKMAQIRNPLTVSLVKTEQEQN